jgi:hypothetical protein
MPGYRQMRQIMDNIDIQLAEMDVVISPEDEARNALALSRYS